MAKIIRQPVSLVLWAVPDEYGPGWSGAIAPSTVAPEDLRRYHGIQHHRNGEFEDFDSPEQVANHVQVLLRRLSEGRVGR